MAYQTKKDLIEEIENFIEEYDLDLDEILEEYDINDFQDLKRTEIVVIRKDLFRKEAMKYMDLNEMDEFEQQGWNDIIENLNKD